MKTRTKLITIMACLCILAACEKPREAVSASNETTNVSTLQVNDETDLTAHPISNAADEDNISFTNVKWKLIAVFDAKTDALIQVLEPKDYNAIEFGSIEYWEDCYTVTFQDDGSFMGKGVINYLHGNSSINPIQKSSAMNLTIGCMTMANHIYDEEFYLNVMNKVDFYSATEDNLKLYYDNQYYLLFEKR